MTGLAGSLLGIYLEPLFGFLHQARRTGSLCIADAPLGGRVFPENGRVVGGVFESKRGVAAFDTIVPVLDSGQAVRLAK
jgi:hypothetical protein